MPRPPRLLIPRRQRFKASVKLRPDKRWAVYYDAEEAGEVRRKRKFFPTFEKASAFCDSKGRDISKFGEDALALSDDLKAEALACHRKLARLTDKGRPITLTQAVEAFIRDSGLASTSLSVGQAVEKYLAHLASKGKSMAYRKSMAFHLAPLVAEFGGDPVATIKRTRITATLERLFASKTLAPASRNNFRNYIATFFSWAVKAEMRYDNPASGLENDDNPAKASRLLSPSDLATIFASTPRKLLPAVGLQALCGVRVAEVARLQWNDIEDGTLYLVGTKTKTGLDRSTPIPPALARYLESQRDRDGQAYIFPCKSVVGATKQADLEDFNRNKQLSKAVGVVRARVKAQGIRWERNSLRVSALSYRNAIVKNAHQVAEEMGNSAHIFKRIYQQSRVKEADAKRWFDTDPARPGVKGFRDPSTIRAEAKETLAKWERANAKTERESAGRSESEGLDDDLDGLNPTTDPNNPED